MFDTPKDLYLLWLTSQLKVQRLQSLNEALFHTVSSSRLDKISQWKVVASLLHVHGADPAESHDGTFILNEAIAKKVPIEIIQLLLTYYHGSLVNNTDPQGNTPLHLAIENQLPLVAFELLLHAARDEKKAKMGTLQSLLLTQNKEGRSALHVAAKMGDSHAIKMMLLASKQIAEKLVALADQNNKTALMTSIETVVAMNPQTADQIPHSLWRFMAERNIISAATHVDNNKNNALHILVQLKHGSQALTEFFHAIGSELWHKAENDQNFLWFTPWTVLNVANFDTMKATFTEISSSPPHEPSKPIGRKRRSNSKNGSSAMLSVFIDNLAKIPNGRFSNNKANRSFNRGRQEQSESEFTIKHVQHILKQAEEENSSLEGTQGKHKSILVGENMWKISETETPFLNELQTKKVQILHELLDTEKNFHNSLWCLEEKYLQPISLFETCARNYRVLSLRKFAILRSSSPVVRHASSIWLEEVQNGFQNVDQFCRKLCTNVWLYKLYGTYIINYQSAATCLSKLEVENEVFLSCKENVGDVISDGKMERMSELSSLLILPIQRVPQIALLYQRIQEVMVKRLLENDDELAGLVLMSAYEHIKSASLRTQAILEQLNSQKQTAK